MFTKTRIRKNRSSILETWHHQCASKKKQNDNLRAVSIATLLVPVSFCQKTKNPNLQLLRWDKGSYLEQKQFPYSLKSHHQIGWVDGSCFKTKPGILIFINTAPAAKLLSCTFVVPSFKNTASMFPEISFIQYFALFSCKQYDIITDLICITNKRKSL